MRMTVLILLALMGSSASGEWTAVSTSDAGMVSYADPATIRRDGSMAKMWDILDYKAARVLRGKQYLSQKTQQEYDCKEQRSRQLHVTLHSGNMGDDDVVFMFNTPNDFKPVARDTVAELLWKVACGKQVTNWANTGSATGNKEFNIYTDATTIRRDGNIARMWVLYDFHTAQVSPFDKKPYLSAKSQQEFDCKGEGVRVIHYSWHSGKMGTGAVVYVSNRVLEWVPTAPGSIIESNWKVSCQKR